MSFPRYPAYKDSGVSWLGAIPSHWAITQSRRVFTQRKDRAAEGTRQLTASQKLGIVYQDEYMASEGQKVVQVIHGADILKQVEPNDFVISMRSFQGGIEWSELRGSISSAYVMLLPNEQVYPPFFRYLFKSQPYIQALQSTTNLVRDGQALRFDNFAQVDLPVVPNDEQVAIAKLLDRETAKIDTLVAEQEQLITLLKEKRQAVISHAVTKGLDPSVPMMDSGVEWLGAVPAHWSVQPLGTLTRAIQTGPFGSQLHSNEYVDDATPVINPSNIIDGQLCPEPSATVTDEVVERLAHHKLIAGDIVVGRRGEMGRCAVVMQPQAGWLCGTGCLKIQLNSTALPEFVWRYLSTETIKQYLSLQSVGSTMENLNTQILARVPVPVPSATEQAAICEAVAGQLKALAALESEAIVGVRLLQERRSALISAAVTGQIDVRSLAPAQERAA